VVDNKARDGVAVQAADDGENGYWFRHEAESTRLVK
jgi:hypothetical protein